MALLSVTVKGLADLQRQLGTVSFGSPLRRTFERAVLQLHHDIRAGVKNLYAAPYDAASVAVIKHGTNTDPTTILQYKYRAIPLSRFPVQQVRITVGNKKLKVTRENKHAAFKRRVITSRAYTYTKVMVLRKGGYKVVEGTRKYGFRKGWLHTGRRSAFTSQIFERNQKPTWEGGERLPFHRLYGPSLSQMIGSRHMAPVIASSPAIRNIEDILREEMRRG